MTVEPWMNLELIRVIVITFQTNSCPLCRHELPTDDPDYEEMKNLKVQIKNSSKDQNSYHVWEILLGIFVAWFLTWKFRISKQLKLQKISVKKLLRLYCYWQVIQQSLGQGFSLATMRIPLAYPAMVQIRSIAEIVPKSLFLYNYMLANRSLIQYGFCANAKSIGYTMWCEHCLSDSPEMGYFREQSNSENIQKSNTLTIFYFGISYCTLCLPLLPPPPPPHILREGCTVFDFCKYNGHVLLLF